VSMPIGVVGRMKNELWGRRIERGTKRRGLAIKGAMASSAIHGVNLHPIDEILVRWQDRAVHMRRTAIGGGIDSAHSKMAFEPWRRSVGVGGKKSKQCETKASQYQNRQGGDNTENEAAHEPPPICAFRLLS